MVVILRIAIFRCQRCHSRRRREQPYKTKMDIQMTAVSWRKDKHMSQKEGVDSTTSPARLIVTSGAALALP